MSASDNLPPGLKPPQFSLRTLLLSITGLAILFALVNVVSPLILTGLVFLLLSIFAHVAGNAIGTRLRDLGSEPPANHRADLQSQSAADMATPTHYAPRTELSRRQSLGWPIRLVSAIGAILASAVGGLWAVWMVPPEAMFLAVAIAGTACGVIGGGATFLAFSFAQVGIGALRQSHGGSATPDEARHP